MHRRTGWGGAGGGQTAPPQVGQFEEPVGQSVGRKMRKRKEERRKKKEKKEKRKKKKKKN